MDKNDINYVILIFGAVLIVVGFFINWIIFHDIFTHYEIGWTGWEVYKKGILDYNYTPLVVLVCGIFVLLQPQMNEHLALH